MKLSVNDTCFSRTIQIDDQIPTFEQKKKLLYKIVDQMKDDESLDFYIGEFTYLINGDKLVNCEYDICGQCGNNNSYEEYNL